MEEKDIIFIRKYTNEKYHDIDKLIQYLDLHNMIGVEVFDYVYKKQGKGESLAFSWGYEPIEANKFIRRIPFFFYVNEGDKYKCFGDLFELLAETLSERLGGDISLEKFYEELEYMFYVHKIDLDDIFNYIIDQTGGDTQPFFMYWVDYLHLIENKKNRDKLPECFIASYNEVLEEEGRECIRYTIEDFGSFEFYKRQGKHMYFRGRFPIDTEGNPIIKWSGLQIKNGGKVINGTCEKSRRGFIDVELTPLIIIDFYTKSIDDEYDGWARLYTGPLHMEFNHNVLKEKRQELKMTQKEVAEAVGANIRTYQKWESGETQPDSYYLIRLLNWLDIDNLENVTKVSW